MRVLFNSLSTIKTKTGVGHYCHQLAAALAPRLGDGNLKLFPDSQWQRLVRSPAPGWQDAGRGKIRRMASTAAKSIARGAINSWFIARQGWRQFDLYHEPNFLPLPSRLPVVITVHDLSVLLHPEWHPKDRVLRHEREFERAVRNANRIITVSDAVRRELLSHLSVHAERVDAVPNGVGPEFFAQPDIASFRQRLQLPNRYLLYVGTIEPRKNLLTLLRAWCDLPARVRESCPLVLAGSWGWKADDVGRYYETTAKHRHVRHIGYIADEDRPAVMAGAAAMVFPSHYEGFGLPPLEMLATGGAVIASTAAAHREVLGSHAHFVEPDDLIGWRDAMQRAATDHDWLALLRRNSSQHAALYVWDRTAAMTIDVYRKVVPLRAAA